MTTQGPFDWIDNNLNLGEQASHLPLVSKSNVNAYPPDEKNGSRGMPKFVFLKKDGGWFNWNNKTDEIYFYFYLQSSSANISCQSLYQGVARFPDCGWNSVGDSNRMFNRSGFKLNWIWSIGRLSFFSTFPSTSSLLFGITRSLGLIFFTTDIK